ncbi:MFS transporter-like protein 154 [Elsinoe australis]|uniref:MFS transporter-like protein 154 n=1 Tax=Elsinoe australis TaxID=40998 RepID=A0A4V6DT60_9PEZI|nr:MFS transporter-like protein 154 [Elsinoe australis]
MAQDNTPQPTQPSSTTTHPTEAVERTTQDVEKRHPLTKHQSTTPSMPPPDLAPVSSYVSGHDIHHAPLTHYETGDEIYDKFPSHRKIIIVTVLSFCSFLAPVSSTTVLAAVPEVAATYNTSGTVINLSNALYQLFMGLSPMFWGPMGQAYGRRWTQLLSAFLFTAFSIGTALAPNLASFFVFRILTAFQGTSFLIIGSACIGDIYRPTERATALSWFLSGTLIGPAFGPFLGGVIVTYKPWRDIFWMQTGIAAGATALVFFFLPETIHYKKSVELEGLTTKEKVDKFWEWMNPLRVIKLFKFPNLSLAAFATATLVWNMYSLLTPIRYVLNPRFNLTTPMQSGLFYIAPGCGYLLGTFFGGRWADHVVKKWIGKRNGFRVPEDRLKSCLIALGVVMPGCILVYGWTVERAVGGIPVPVIAMFVQGIAQLFCFPSLNTYCLDVMKERSSEVVAGNYVFRYLFGCIGSAVVLPFVQKYGVGWFSTLSAGLMAASAVGVWATTVWGQGWREKVLARDAEKASKKAAKRQPDLQQQDASEEK